MKKVLITGAGGQVGRALQKQKPDFVTVIAVDRLALDIGDRLAVQQYVAATKPDVIINAAAYTAVDRAETESALAYQINRDAPGYLAEAAKAVDAKFVHISTDFVFDGALARFYRADDAPNPLGVYGASKLAGEQQVHAIMPEALIVRTAWVYAAEGANFVKTMLRLMAERGRVSVVADQIGTPTHAHSLARALWALIARGASSVHHFTDAGLASWYDFAVAIAEEAYSIGLIKAAEVLPIDTADYPTPAKRPAFAVLDKSETWAITGTARHWRAELRMMLAEIEKAKN